MKCDNIAIDMPAGDEELTPNFKALLPYFYDRTDA